MILPTSSALLVGSLLVALTLPHAPPRGVDITVNSTLDLPDADPNDGVPDADLATAGEQITLRAAIQHLNGSMDGGTIHLPAGKYLLKRKGHGEDAAATGDLDILNDITIVGDGPKTTIIDGMRKDRVFHVFGEGALGLANLTIRNGKTQVNEDDVDDGGGAILVTTTLVVGNCVLTKNASRDDGGAIEALDALVVIFDSAFLSNQCEDDGAAIDADSCTVLIERSTFARNKAKDEGGAIENTGGEIVLRNTTFSGNSAKDDGGALSLEDFGETLIESCTFEKNKAPNGGAIHSEDDGSDVSTRNSIFGKNKNVNCAGPLVSLGGNLDAGSSCGFGAGDLSNTDPRLLGLKSNGGPTPTHALRPDSPCVDAGTDTDCLATDQRELGRVDIPGVGTATCDIGAFELQTP